MWPRILALHIVDGFLNIPVSLVGWGLACGILWLALRQSRRTYQEGQTPLMGVVAAFIFVAQMINFPIPGGTSGHLIGGTLVVILLGPWAGILVMSSVVIVQGLLFQDGGLLAMGFNIVNLGVLTCLVSYLIYQPLEYHRLAIALAAWASVVVAAAATALELAASGSIALGAVLPAMLAVHVFIGIGEALITLAVLAFLEETRPDLLMRSETTSAQGVLAGGLVLTLGIILLAPLTSSQPDGLERVAEDKGFLQLAHTPFYKILPDYTLPWIENPTLTMLVAGLIGMIVVWLVAYVIGKTRTASLKPK